jgi:hypothetical protein
MACFLLFGSAVAVGNGERSSRFWRTFEDVESGRRYPLTKLAMLPNYEQYVSIELYPMRRRPNLSCLTNSNWELFFNCVSALKPSALEIPSVCIALEVLVTG